MDVSELTKYFEKQESVTETIRHGNTFYVEIETSFESKSAAIRHLLLFIDVLKNEQNIEIFDLKYQTNKSFLGGEREKCFLLGSMVLYCQSSGDIPT